MDPSPRPRMGLGPTIQQRLSELNAHQIQASDADHQRAQELMLQQRLELNKTASTFFTHKDANLALAKVARGAVSDATAGLVQSLLEYGADVCFARRKSTSIWKAVLKKDQEDIPSDALEHATRNCSDDIVHLLAKSADVRAASQALLSAILRHDAVKAAILMEADADASPLCEPFLSAVDSGPEDLVGVLLTGPPKGACQACLNSGLVRAATLGFVLKGQTLLDKGADVTFENAAALREAVRGGWEKIVTAIATHPTMKSHPELLDVALGEAYSQAQYGLLETILQAGARGTSTDTALVMATEYQQADLVDTLVKYGASVSHDEGAAVRSAAKNGRHDLLQILLQNKPPQAVMAAAITQTTALSSVRLAHQMIDLLLSAGLRGDAVSETLIQALSGTWLSADDQSRLELIRMLLTKGQAAVDFRGGQSLARAVAAERTEVVRLLLRYRPSLESLSLALDAAMKLERPEMRLTIVRMILLAGPDGQAVNPAVRERVGEIAFIAAARGLRFDTLGVLAEFAASETVFSEAFAAATSEGQQWLTPDGLCVVNFLLNSGASGSRVDDAFSQAARLCNQDAVELLFNHIGPESMDNAWAGVVQHAAPWTLPVNLWLVEFFLENRSRMGTVSTAFTETTNWAFLEAVAARAKGGGSKDLVDGFFVMGVTADVNFRDGEALKIAIRAGHARLLGELVSRGASREAMTQALATIIASRLHEDKLLPLIDVLAKSGDAPNDFNTGVVFHNGLPLIAACLSEHPQCSRLAKRLIKLGCDLEIEFQSTLYGDGVAGNELTTVLPWALGSQRERRVSSPAIEALIDAKANVNFAAPVSGATPLILAAKHGRFDIVRKLLSAKAATTARDGLRKTALFYAAQAGDLKSVRELVKANSRADDGSLHEASRNLHHAVVDVLIGAKHDPSFRSVFPEHGGRTALQELVYKCDGTRNLDGLAETLLALEKGKVNVLAPYGDKNALFLAFENPQPLPIAMALLDTILWRLLNHEENVFVETNPVTKRKVYFSPTMYLAKGRGCGGNPAQRGQLLDLLYQKHCVDRFYVEYGQSEVGAAQPSDAVGVPARIAKEEERRRNRDYEHQCKMKHEIEQAQIKADIEQRRHVQRQSRLEMQRGHTQ